MKIQVGISNHHLHLTKEVFKILFEKEELTLRRNLVQPGEYAAEETVTLKVNDKIIEHVRIIGPFRKYTQVELLKKDAEYLEINPPERDSGDLDNSSEITIIGSNGEVTLQNCTIIANRHIHLPSKLLNEYPYKDKDIVSVKTNDGKIIDNVHIKVREDFELEFHINKDDAENFSLINGEEVEIC